MYLQNWKSHPLFPMDSITITCRICNCTFDLEITSAMIITLEMNKKQQIFTLLLYICIKNVEKHVKFEPFSWNSHPSPGTRVCLNFVFMKRTCHTCRSYWFSKVERRLETRIYKISTKYDYRLSFSWKQEITCRATWLFVNKNATNHPFTKKDQF